METPGRKIINLKLGAMSEERISEIAAGTMASGEATSAFTTEDPLPPSGELTGAFNAAATDNLRNRAREMAADIAAANALANKKIQLATQIMQEQQAIAQDLLKKMNPQPKSQGPSFLQKMAARARSIVS